MKCASILGLWIAAASLSAVLDTAVGATPQPAAALPKVEPRDLDLRKGWFKPVIAQDADAICGRLTAAARRHFLSPGDWPQYVSSGLTAGTGLMQVPTDEATRTTVGLHGLPDEPAQWVLERPKQTPLFLYLDTRPGCAGTCRSQSLIVSDQHIVADTSSNGSVTTPAAEAWTLYHTSAGTWYVAGLVDQHLLLYALTTPSQWHLSCDVALTPYRLRSTLDGDVRAALSAIDALYDSAQALTSEPTACRHNILLRRALEQSLYRPWEWLQEDSAAHYQQLLTDLTEWSAAGPIEAAALDRYAAELSNSIGMVQYLYSRKFGWSVPAATRVAYDALTGVMGSTLSAATTMENCGRGTRALSR